MSQQVGSVDALFLHEAGDHVLGGARRNGEYVVGIDGAEREVGPGDSLLIPAGTVHWYRNEGDREGALLCIGPHGDDGIQLLE